MLKIDKWGHIGINNQWTCEFEVSNWIEILTVIQTFAEGNVISTISAQLPPILVNIENNYDNGYQFSYYVF